MPSNLKEYLLSRGFVKGKKNCLEKALVSDTFVRVTICYGSWRKPEDIHIYLIANPFGHLMTEMFKVKETVASRFEPRRLIKDKEGCLGMVTASVELTGDLIANAELYATNKPVRVHEFAERLESLVTLDDLFEDVFDGMICEMLIPMEGVWGFLYFSKRLGMSPEEALACAISPEFHGHRKFWSLKTELNLDVIRYFYDQYDLHLNSD